LLLDAPLPPLISFGAAMKTPLVIPPLVPLCLLIFTGWPLFGDENAAGLASYDAIVAAPDNHKVVFENEKVRVLEVTIKPGEKEPFHEHSMFSVMNIITGAPLRITEATMQDGRLVTGKTIEVGKDDFQPPPLWMPPQGLHSAENVGSVTFHAYRIELKEPGSK
jgi:mannose-6-phosphate isomerase-like protein (cupin superfamily)